MAAKVLQFPRRKSRAFVTTATVGAVCLCVPSNGDEQELWFSPQETRELALELMRLAREAEQLESEVE